MEHSPFCGLVPVAQKYAKTVEILQSAFVGGMDRDALPKL